MIITLYTVRHQRGTRDPKKPWKISRQWRWQMRARNGKIIGASTESYTRLSMCLKNIFQVTGIQIWSDDYDKKIEDGVRFRVTLSGSWNGRRMTARQPAML